MRTADWVEEYKYTGTDPMHVGDWEAGIESGPPHSVAVFNGELLVVPIPSTTGDYVGGRYVKDIGTPTYKHDGSAWVFYQPDGTTPLTDTYTNAWFTDGRDALRTRAMYYLQTNIYRDIENAQVALAENQDVVNRYRVNTNKKIGTALTVRGYF